MLSSASASGFQIVVSGSQAKALNDFQIVNIQVSAIHHQKRKCAKSLNKT